MKGYFRKVMNIGVVLIFMQMLLVHNNVFAQTTVGTANGLWTTPGNWVGGVAPPLTGISNTITINTTFPKYISAGSYPPSTGVVLNFDGSNDDKAITVNGTLVVYGDMDFENKAMDLTIPSGGVVIILGDLIMNNKIDLSLGGILVVKGNFSKTGGGQGTFSGTGQVYAGSYSGAAGDLIPPASELLVNPDLINNPSLQYIEDFLNNNGQFPLPIQLLFFKAIQSGEKVVLSWATASEKNFDYFSIERSANGMDFNEIEQIKGNGTTNERKDYRLEDTYPLIGRNYYRLKSVDFDGYTEYFNIVLVNFSGEKTFNVFPNPSDGTAVNFALNFVPEGNTTITIFDNYSSNIATVKPTDPGQLVTFATSLKSGLYFARIVSKDFVRVERFVVK